MNHLTSPPSWCLRFGIKQLRLPVVDHTEPSLSDLKRAVAFIEEKQVRPVSLLVHVMTHLVHV